MGADVAGAFDAAGARQRRAFGQAEGLLFEGVDDLGHVDAVGVATQPVAAAGAPGAGNEVALGEQFQDFADDGLAQAQIARQFGRAADVRRTGGHVREHEDSVIDDLADPQHRLFQGRALKTK